jgi:hypothetical protein
VKRWEVLGRTRTPDGSELTLTRHTSEDVILINGQILMSSRMHGSEEALAVLGPLRQIGALRNPTIVLKHGRRVK